MKIAVCEDEKIYQDALCGVLADYFASAQTALFCDGGELLAQMEKGARYDLILMDLELENSDGVATSEAVREMDGDVEIIFVTADDERTTEGYKVRALDYILKEEAKEKLKPALDRFMKTREKKRIALTLEGGETGIINLKNLWWVESDGRGTRLALLSNAGHIERAYSPWPIGKVSALLSPDEYVEVFKSVFARIERIRRVESDAVTMEDGTQLPLSRRKRSGLMTVILRTVRAR